MTTETDFITRCPQCSTAFRVTADVLNIANGAVRCGSCLRVFNAKQYLLDREQDTPGTTLPTNKKPLIDKEPLADKKSLTDKEPLADKESSTIKEPSANKKPLAFKEPSTHEQFLTPEEPSTQEANQALPNQPSPTQPPHQQESTSEEVKKQHATFPSDACANDEPDESWALALLEEAEKTDAQLADDTLDDDLIFAEKADDFVYEIPIQNNDARIQQTPLTEGLETSQDASTAHLNEHDTFDQPITALTEAEIECDQSPDSLFVDIINNDLLDESATLTNQTPIADRLDSDEDVYSTLIPNEPVAPSSISEQAHHTGDKQNDATVNSDEIALIESTASASHIIIDKRLNDDGWADDLLVDDSLSADALSPLAASEQAAEPKPLIHSASTDTTTQANQPRNDLSPVNLTFERDAIHFGEEKARTRRWPWALGSLLLTLILLGQIAWWKLDSWSALPDYRIYYEHACQVIGCELPIQSDISQIRSTHLVVRSHPEQKNALIADAIIANNAPFPQPFPGIRLVFLDINEQHIASRIFAPAEYVKGELFGETMMPAKQSIQLSLAITDPGKQAVNYRLEIVPTPP